jgi:hypothetical protein
LVLKYKRILKTISLKAIFKGDPHTLVKAQRCRLKPAQSNC